MHKDSKIFVAGHRGLVGSALVRNLEDQGYSNLVLRSRDELDLLDYPAVDKFFVEEAPEYVFLAAAKVGGILANSKYPAEFLFHNLEIQNNVIHSSYRAGVKKLVFLGSTCIYPKHAPQPLKEEYLLTGELEPTNDAYAIAKIAGIKLIEAYNKQYGTEYISVMPTNLYGPNDNFHPEHSHVFPAFIRRFHEAKISQSPTITIWGTGKVYREFLHVDDMADATIFLMKNYKDNQIINIGYGSDITVRELAELIARVVGYEGEILHDTSKPDGTPRKQVDVTKLFDMGWRPNYSLEEGIQHTYEWFLANQHVAKL